MWPLLMLACAMLSFSLSLAGLWLVSPALAGIGFVLALASFIAGVLALALGKRA